MPARRKQKTKSTQAKSAVAKSKATAKPKPGKNELAAATAADFAEVFSALKNVMSAYAGDLKVTTDEPRKYYVVTKSLNWKGGPMFFGAVISGKAYVSYHLMPLYICPDLTKQISPDLKRRMQGKTCFNFRNSEEALFAQLGKLTKSGLEAFRAKNLL
jgi:hypothetical protein